MLEVIDLELIAGGKPILHDLNLKVREGEIHSILGANGTGKSTLAAVLMGLSGYQPSAGRVLFRGEDITHLSLTERARHHPGLAGAGAVRRVDRVRVSDDRPTGLGKRFPQPKGVPHQGGPCAREVPRSGGGRDAQRGERKRVELASVLAMQPRLAILDEPDSGIDALSIDRMVDVIRTLSRAGAAVLLITHQEKVAAIADRASSLCGGTILKTGDPAAITRFFRNHCHECPHVNQPQDEELSYA